MAAAAIPDFVSYDEVQFPVLPQGIHEADVATIEATFVTAFGGNAQRREVFDGWMAFRQLLGSLVPITAEYVDGSFISGKPHPKDIDVSFWVQADDIFGLDPQDLQAFQGLMAQSQAFHVDAFVVPECDLGHPAHQDFTFMLWTEHYWTRCRDKSGVLLPPHTRRKGFLRVVS